MTRWWDRRRPTSPIATGSSPSTAAEPATATAPTPAATTAAGPATATAPTPATFIAGGPAVEDEDDGAFSDRTPAPTPTPDRRKPAEPGARRRDALLWLWFVLVVIVMAVASTVAGQYGALVAALVLTAGVVLFVGYLIIPPKPMVAVFAVASLAVGGLFVARALHWSALTDRPATAGAAGRAVPADTAGRHLTAAVVRATPRRGAVWPGVNLDGEIIQDWDLTGLSAVGASMHGTWLEGARLAGADLRGADLGRAHLRGADLRASDLRGADLRKADLSAVCLVGADLTGALLTGADATGAATADSTWSPREARLATWPRVATATALGCP